MKTYNVYLLPDAVKDLENIYEYITEQSGFPERAWAYIERLRTKCQDLETAPQRGQQRNDLMESIRVCPLDKRTVAAFVIDEKKTDCEHFKYFLWRKRLRNPYIIPQSYPLAKITNFV